MLACELLNSFLLLISLACPPLSCPHAGDNPEWWELIKTQMEKWRLVIERLVTNVAKRPVLVVRYEDLKRDEAGEARRMLEFLNIPYSERKLGGGYTRFFRNHTDAFDHFTKPQKQYVNGIITQVVRKMKSRGIADELQLEQYIRH